MDEWEELGIAPTADPAMVRQAYARRLKTLDIEGDPAAFMSLRQAFDDALAWSGEEHPPSESAPDYPDDERPESLDGDEPNGGVRIPSRVDVEAQDGPRPRPAEVHLPRGAGTRFRETFEVLIAAGDTRAASAAFQTALADGVVGLGEERPLAVMLAARALADETLTVDEIDAFNLRLGGQWESAPDPKWKPLNDLRLRAEAIRWQARILRDAPLGHKSFIGLGVLRRRVRIAHALAYRDDLNLISRDLPTFADEISKAKRYAPWLDPRFPVDALDAKYARMTKTLPGSEGGAIGLGFLFICGIAIRSWPLALFLGIIFLLMLLWMFKWSDR